MKILVIEDDALLLQGLILAMQSEGYVRRRLHRARSRAIAGQQSLQPDRAGSRPAG